MPKRNRNNGMQRLRPGFYLATLANGWTVGRFDALDRVADLAHMVATRRGFDVQAAKADPPAAAKEIAKTLGLSDVAFCKQVHGNRVWPVSAGGLAGQGDALVTNSGSLGVMGFSADCPLILVADPEDGAVGVAHASWRATAGRIALHLVQALIVRYGCDPGELLACICPSAGPCCYEVGPEVLEAVKGGMGGGVEEFFPRRDGKLFFDLWAANTAELLRAGLLRENIHVAGVCTLCRNDLFSSYRTEGESAGRFVAVLGRL